MLKEWRLKNFKSFGNLPPVSLAPINVLAGANSSGKSSIIQSILLLKQTLQYGPTNRPVTLNGPLLRLGAFEDARNFFASNDTVEIGFDLDLGEESDLSPWLLDFRRRSVGNQTSTRISLNLSYIARDNKINQHPATSSLTPILSQVRLRTSGPTGKVGAEVTFSSLPDTGEGDEGSLHFYKAKVDPETESEALGGRPSAEMLGGWLTHFLPQWLYIRYDVAKLNAERVVDAIFEPVNSLFSTIRDDTELSPAVIQLISAWLITQPDAPPSIIIGNRVADVRDQLRPLLEQARGLSYPGFFVSRDPDTKLAAEIAELQNKVLSLMYSEVTSNLDWTPESPRNISTAITLIRDYIKDGIRYLGPLRDNPRPVYQLEALESTTNVGYRGEHTAAVLDLNRNSHIQYRSPPSTVDSEDYVLTTAPKTASLHDAVVEWLTYLGVADDVVTTDAGVFGNRLRVSTDGVTGRLHDLTNVGVGVSQVLPLIVTALLAPYGSLLIFEQPELHLHPKVQARLADFVLALAMDGKQTLLETHSEYLVDRLRLRIALSSDDSVRPLVNILFTEKREGLSNLTEVQVNEFGAIVNWPKDFFEQSQREVGRIVRAASAKRQKSARK